MASRDPRRGASRTGRLALLGAALACALTLARPAAAGDVEVMGYLIQSAGMRHSFGLETTGLDLRLGLGGYVGVIGLELESGWTADHPFHKPRNRTAARHTTWLNLQGRILAGPIRIVVGAGGGLGWIKEPGPEVLPKYPSQGFHYYVEVAVLPEWDDFLGVGLRIEPQHLWQGGIAPRPEHALTARLVFWFGGYAE